MPAIVFVQIRTTKLSYSNCSYRSPTAWPILTYCTAAVKLSVTHLSHLNACWNSVYRRLFGFHRRQSVRSCINGLGRLNFHHIRLVLMAKFYKLLSITESVQLKSMYEQLRRIDANYSIVSLWKFLEVDFSLPFSVLKFKIVSKCNIGYSVAM